MPFVCVQPMLTSRARCSEDLTFDKTDEKDAVLIARLTAQLRCYVPEPVAETWGRLRHLGARRDQLITEALPGPADPRPARVRLAGRVGHRPTAVPVRTWAASMGWSWTATAATSPGPGVSAGPVRAAVRREIPRRVGRNPVCGSSQAVRRAGRPAGVIAHRPGAWNGSRLLLEDWQPRRTGWSRPRPGCAVLDELGLTELVTSITGLSPVGAARSWPRPATRTASPPPGLWSSTPAWLPARSSRATSRPHQAHRPRATRATGGRVACSLGSLTRQRRLPGQVSTPDHP